MTGKGICHSRNAVAPDDLEHAIRMRVAQLRREVDADLLGSFTDPAHMPYVIDIARMTTPPEDPADRHFWNIITNELRQLAQQEIEAEQEEASDIETATEAETASNVSVASGRMCKRFM
jgi:hypothetical protein